MNKSAIIVLLAVFFLLPGIALAGFTDNGNGTVTDTVTGILWQQCSAGFSGVGCIVSGPTITYTWDNAIAYCEGLSLGGFTDWRLPNIKELRSIVDPTKAAAPAINTTYFPATVSSSYRSSTSFAPGTSSAWRVVFADGGVSGFLKVNTAYVRCVR